MGKLKVEKHWGVIYISVALLVCVCLYLIFRFNRNIIVHILTNNIITWPDIALLIGSAVVLFLIFGGMIWIILSDAYINFTSDGIHKPGLRSKVIRWRDIEKIDNLTYQIVFISVHDVKIRVNLLLLKDVESFLHEINQRLPPHLRN